MSSNELAFFTIKPEASELGGLIAAGLLHKRRPIQGANEARPKRGEQFAVYAGLNAIEESIRVKAAHIVIINIKRLKKTTD